MGDICRIESELTTGSCRIESEFTAGSILIEGDLDVGTGGRLPPYEGDYTVIPKIEAQTLDTKNKSLTDDIVVEEIPYSEVSNPSGGNTVNIAYIL